jgi:hypothetical protein
VWVAREPAVFELFASTLAVLNTVSAEGTAPFVFTQQLYCTRGAAPADEHDDVGGGPRYQCGRPDLATELTGRVLGPLVAQSKRGATGETLEAGGRGTLQANSHTAMGGEGRTLVAVCGPVPLIASASDVALDAHYDFHHEVFGW